MSDDLDLEAGRLLFARPFVFVKGRVRISDLPPADRTGVAFAGRSKVGKSARLNALVEDRQHLLAQPGIGRGGREELLA